MNATFVDLAGAALLHSLWQGALIAGLLALTLHLLRGVSPAVRYLVCWAALVAMVAVPVGVVLGGRGGQGGPGGLDGVAEIQDGAVHETVAPEFVLPGLGETGQMVLPLPGAEFAPFLVVFWLVGVLFMLARLGRGWWTVRQLRWLPGEALGEEVLQAINRLKNRMGISRAVRLVATDRAGEPMLIGWLKPVVLIPTALLAGMPVAHVEAILAHELAHIRRHDYLFAVLQSLFEAVLFYHPAAWWISGKIREERERACDDLAVEAIHSRATYARALAGLEVQRLGGFQLALPAGGGSLLSRIQRLVEPPAPDRLRSSAGAVLAVVMVVGCGGIAVACMENAPPASVPAAAVRLEQLGVSLQLPVEGVNEAAVDPHIEVPSLHPLGDTTRVVSGFGMRFHPVLQINRFHNGVDFVAETGKPVYATAAGTVTSVETTTGYGQIIRIAHDDGFETWFAQLSQQLVAEGDSVRAGQHIGAVGSSGLSTAPHLHYEVHKDSKPVDPASYLPGSNR